MASSLSVWYLSRENHVWSWVCGSSTTNTPTLKFPLLVLYEPREPHPEMRKQTRTAPTGKMVAQSELFTDDGAAPLKILQSVLSLETILQRVHRGLKLKKQYQRLTAGCWWSLDIMREMSVLDVTAKVKGSHYRFPQCTGEFGVGEQRPKISGTITMQ